MFSTAERMYVLFAFIILLVIYLFNSNVGISAAMYGEQLIIFQYLPHMGELIASCRRRLSSPLEGGVVACLQLVKYLVPFMSDVKVMEQLQVSEQRQ